MNLPLTLRFARPALLGIARCAALLGCAGTWVGDAGTLDERVMINRAVMRKFGFTLGEVLLSFQRPAP